MADTNFDFRFQGLNLYPNAMDHMLESPDGEVGRFLHARGVEIVAAAKAQVGVDTRELQNAIHMVHHRAGVGQHLWIGADVPHAYEHHEGTSPHVIQRANQQFLRFSRGGRQIYTHRVNHPGTSPNRYLSDNLYLAVR